jgi:hypothetical protein
VPLPVIIAVAAASCASSPRPDAPRLAVLTHCAAAIARVIAGVGSKARVEKCSPLRGFMLCSFLKSKTLGSSTYCQVGSASGSVRACPPCWSE